MKLYLPSLYLLLVSILLIIVSYPSQVHAATLDQAMVRLDRTAENAPVSGLICATPSTAGAGTEGQLRVTFPIDFSLSSNESNWTTGTADIPSGTTAWPGISSTAQSVSGNVVTFASNDLLSAITNYCFTFTAGSSTVGQSGRKSVTLTTATSGGSTIDSNTFGLSVTDDQIGVTARVAAEADDFSVSLQRLSPGNLYGADQTIDYELTYRNLLTIPVSDITLEVNWSLGTIYGSAVPTVDVLQYEGNSATVAYNNAPAIIDPLNRTLTWSVGTIPAHHTGTVRFRLRTKNTYQGPHDVSFTTSGRLTTLDTATSYSTNTAGYKYGFIPPTTPGPTSTPAPEVPKEAPRTPFRLHTIELQSITANTVRLGLTFSHPATITTSYGISPRNLNQHFSTLVRAPSHTLTFPDLSENTPYYFRFTATDDAGRQLTSDIYTFTTARAGELPEITQDSFIATSEKNLLFTFLDRKQTDGRNFIVLPPRTVFETQFAFGDESRIKNSLLLVRNRNILGVNTFTNQVEAATSGVTMLEIKPGVFTGRLQSSTPGYYELYARISDYNGSIVEEKLADMKVSKPFQLRREDNHDPVERARVFLSLYNPTDKVYVPISPQVLSINNPVYSEPDGSVPLVLPPGKFRAEIEGLGFEKKIVDFTIGIHPSEEYPTVMLTKRPFSLLYGVQYLLLVGSDLGLSLSSFVLDLGNSRNLMNFIGFIVIASFVFLTLIALSHRTHVRLSHMPRYFLTLIHLAHGVRNPLRSYNGIVHDGHTKEPLAEVDIFASDVETGKIVSHTKTNMSGKFQMNLPGKYVYILSLEKLGYHPASVHLHHLKRGEEQQFALLETEEQLTFMEGLGRLSHSLLNLSFEILLLLSVTSTIVLSYTIGFWPILPFLVLAIFNLVFWGMHELHVKQ